MLHADCAGRTVSYEAGGPDDSSAPLILFQPPGASGASIWRPIAAMLRDSFRTAAVNPAGYGDTAPFTAPAPMTLRDEAALFAAVIRVELPKSRSRAAHIVGHSYGGTIALTLALAWPELVGRLTLLEPAPYVLLRQAGETALADEIETQNRSFIATVRGGGPDAEAMERYMDYFNNRPGFWRSMDDRAQAKMLALAKRLADGLDAVERLDMRCADLASIALPVTVIRGGATDPLHARLSELVAQSIPDATLIDLPGAGHMMTLTHGAKIAEMLKRM